MRHAHALSIPFVLPAILTGCEIAMKARIKRLASGVKNYLGKDRTVKGRKESATAARQEINKTRFINLQPPHQHLFARIMGQRVHIGGNPC